MTVVDELRLLLEWGVLDKHNTHDRNYMLNRLVYTEKELKELLYEEV